MMFSDVTLSLMHVARRKFAEKAANLRGRCGRTMSPDRVGVRIVRFILDRAAFAEPRPRALPARPFFVVTTMTPFDASVPYSVAADGPFTISMSSMSSGFNPVEVCAVDHAYRRRLPRRTRPR